MPNQSNLLRMLCEVCDDIFEIWKDATRTDNYEIRRLVMRETSGCFFNLDTLIRQVEILVNKELNDPDEPDLDDR